jgi:hypothetical protein
MKYRIYILILTIFLVGISIFTINPKTADRDIAAITDSLNGDNELERVVSLVPGNAVEGNKTGNRVNNESDIKKPRESTISIPTSTKPTSTKPTSTKPTSTKPTSTKPTSTKPDKTDVKDKQKVIAFEKNEFGRDGWAAFTGYNDDNILNTYVVGEDIEAGTYWTGVKNDPCYGSVVTTANGERYMNLEHGEQSVFYLQKGDSLVTKCNWYQGGMPEYKNESPTGMILASQLGIGTFKAKNTGSCILKREYINNFVNAKTIFLFEEKDQLLIKITQEDIEKNTVIALIDRCGGLVRV